VTRLEQVERYETFLARTYPFAGNPEHVVQIQLRFGSERPGDALRIRADEKEEVLVLPTCRGPLTKAILWLASASSRMPLAR
jgi:hypothetical protein